MKARCKYENNNLYSKSKRQTKRSQHFIENVEVQKYIENHNNRYYLVEGYIIV